MKASELRIGNWISLGNRIGYLQSVWSKTQYIVIDEEETQDTIESIDRFKPIKLTEEWLIKFGFEKTIKEYVETSISFILNGYSITRNRALNEYWNVCNKVPDNLFFITNVQYVHQLQNLYFALTGKELETK